MDRPRNIVILTGAGISAESGLRTFRADDGLWEDHRVEDVASPQGFRRDPQLVQRFYDAYVGPRNGYSITIIPWTNDRWFTEAPRDGENR